MKYKLKPQKRYRLRIIIPAYPAFNIYSFIADKTTALGPICVASAANEVEGWEVEVIDENNLRRFGPRSTEGGADHLYLQKERPADVVGIYGGLTSTIPRLYKLANFYKENGVITIAGGQHFVPETIPEALSSGLDVLILGEGEKTIKELLNAFRKGRDINSISGIVYKEKDKIIYTKPRLPIEDLDSLPLPDFSLLRYAKIILYPIGRVRGCGMNCEFCTVKGRPRYASPQRLLEQVAKTLETMEGKEFFIVDDLFGQRRNETIQLCKMLKDYQERVGVKLNFTAQIRLDKAKDTELLQAMREAGINTVAIGFESPIPEELEAMNKHLKPDEIIELTRIFHQHGFFIHGMFIFGYPMRDNQTFHMNAEERVKYFKRFIYRARIDTIQVLLPVPLPGTELRDRLSRENRIYPLEVIGWEYYDGNFPIIEPDPPLTPEDMQMAIRKIMGRFYQMRIIIMWLLNMLSLPHIIFYLHNLKKGWAKWYRRWRNYGLRFLGAKIIKGWTNQLYRGTFFEKLKEAKTHLHHQEN